MKYDRKDEMKKKKNKIKKKIKKIKPGNENIEKRVKTLAASL